MALLKTIKQLAVILLFLLPGNPLIAQQVLIEAFRTSYQLEENGRYLQAANAIREVAPTDSYEANLRLGWLYYLGGNMNESIIHYNRAISLKPYAIEPRLGLALPLSANGRWDDILAQYNKILEVDPQHSLTNYRIGLIYFNRRQFERAETYIERVINLYPFDYDAMLLFAWIKLNLGKTREARVLFNKVLLYNPDDESALEGLGLIQ